jgi:6-phosphogluconolactonase/glucosamine-6-phosphate isomerase/deaminase
MMRDAGLLRYLEMRDIRFYPILNHHSGKSSGASRNQSSERGDSGQSQNDVERRVFTESYDKTLRELFSLYRQTVGILGVGLDGHTAGLPAQNSKSKIQKSNLYDTFDYVTEYNDEGGFYGERVTMTFTGLSMLDLLIVLVFGDDKKMALDLLFEDGKEENIPSRFFKRPEIAKKTIIITDQNV